MDYFTADLTRRIRETEQALKQAVDSGDDFLAEVQQEELQDLVRMASDHGVQVLPETAA